MEAQKKLNEKKLNELSNQCYSTIQLWVKDNWYKKLRKTSYDLLETFLMYGGSSYDEYEILCDELGQNVVNKELLAAINAANQSW